jgi:hypothetical protein
MSDDVGITNFLQTICPCGKTIDLQTARKDGYGVRRCGECLKDSKGHNHLDPRALQAIKRIEAQADMLIRASAHANFVAARELINQAALYKWCADIIREEFAGVNP